MVSEVGEPVVAASPGGARLLVFEGIERVRAYDPPAALWKTSRTHTRTRMNAGADSLLTVRWRDRSFVLRAPEQVGELARRLGQKGLTNTAVSIRGAVVEGKTGSEKVLSDEEREAVCAVLTDAESDPALRRAFNLLCAELEPLEAT
jgi:hypothetical protein